jgi:hypothetical protein
VLLTETIRAFGLDTQLSTGLGRWRNSNAVHAPAKIVLDLASRIRSWLSPAHPVQRLAQLT